VNPENKKQIIIAGTLAVVLVGVLLWQFVFRSESTPPPVPQGQTTKVASVTGGAVAAVKPKTLKRVDIDVDALLRDIEVVTFDYDAERIERQPMRPLVRDPLASAGDAEVPTAAPFQVRQKRVTAIVWDESKPVAVVDDAVVWEGYTYPGDVVVETIERNRVWFRIANQRIPVEIEEL
jgi:hypothetical protein